VAVDVDADADVAELVTGVPGTSQVATSLRVRLEVLMEGFRVGDDDAGPFTKAVLPLSLAVMVGMRLVPRVVDKRSVLTPCCCSMQRASSTSVLVLSDESV
jgi:hypothetical protein